MNVTVIELLTPNCISEGSLKEFLAAHPSIVEEGATYVSDEFILGNGRIDMVMMMNEKILFIELKVYSYKPSDFPERCKDQLIKYYISILGLVKLFGFDEKKFKIYLVAGFRSLTQERRYNIDIKIGKIFSKALPKRFRDLKDSEVTASSREIVLLGQEKEVLEKEVDALQGDLEALKAEKKEILRIQRYGDRLLYILPDFWYSEPSGSSKCFVCGDRSDIALRISGDRMYGLCNEHFKMLSGFTPKTK